MSFYRYPDEVPWTSDYRDLQALRTGRPLPPEDDDPLDPLCYSDDDDSPLD